MRFCIFLFLFYSQLSAQTNSQFWFRINGNIALTPQVGLTAEFNQRWQSKDDIYSFFDKDLASAMRLWIHIKLKSNHQIHLSPIAYFSNLKYKSDDTRLYINEYRWHIQYEGYEPINSKTSLNARIGLEHRIFEGSVDSKIRTRMRIGYWYKLNPQWTIMFHDELMVNINKINTDEALDQNRLIFQTSYTINPILKLEFGTGLFYIHINNVKHSDVWQIFSTFNFSLN